MTPQEAEQMDNERLAKAKDATMDEQDELDAIIGKVRKAYAALADDKLRASAVWLLLDIRHVLERPTHRRIASTATSMESYQEQWIYSNSATQPQEGP